MLPADNSGGEDEVMVFGEVDDDDCEVDMTGDNNGDWDAAASDQDVVIVLGGGSGGGSDDYDDGDNNRC